MRENNTLVDIGYIPAVSICIPAYNNVEFIKRLLKSIEIQDYEDYVVVISDDSNSDDVQNYIQECSLFRKIHYNKNKNPLGAGRNCNAAIRIGRLYSPRYIKVMHHDDFFSFPYSLRKMVDMLDENPMCALAFCGTYEVSEEKTYSRCISDVDLQLLKHRWEYIYIRNVIGAPSAVILRSDAFNLFDENLSWLIDVGLYMEVFYKNNYFVCTEEPLISIGHHQGQLTNECVHNAMMIRYENKYLYDKYPSLHNPDAQKTLMHESMHGLGVFNKLILRMNRYIFLICYHIKYVKNELWWYKFSAKRYVQNLRRHLRNKEPDETIELQYNIVKYLTRISLNHEQSEVLDWLKSHYLRYVFPYDFVKKYDKIKIEVLHEDGRPYVIYDGKKMFFKISMDDQDIINYMKSIYCEQDEESPHFYKIDKAWITGKNVADMGAAEGFFSLSIIDYVKKIYIFECDEEWNEALRKTFEPYNDKVEIINKFVDNKNTETCITVDKVFDNIDLHFIKADIEGYEIPMLQGGKKRIMKSVEHVVLCSYHNNDDEMDIKSILQECDFMTYTSPGYMIFTYGKPLTEPYIRRGLIYGTARRLCSHG